MISIIMIPWVAAPMAHSVVVTSAMPKDRGPPRRHPGQLALTIAATSRASASTDTRVRRRQREATV